MVNITANDIRARLRTLTEIEVSDELLSSAVFIPAGDAWFDVVFKNSGRSLAEMSESEQALAAAAKVAFVAHKVISSAPVRGSKSGPVEIRPVSEKEKNQICSLLEQEWQRYLRLLGCSEQENWWSGSFGGSGYE